MIKNFLLKLKAEGWTQEAIAATTGIRQGLISTYMKGGDVKASTLVKFAKAFHVSTDSILGIEEDTPPPRNKGEIITMDQNGKSLKGRRREQHEQRNLAGKNAKSRIHRM